jgi:hypothetical protein
MGKESYIQQAAVRWFRYEYPKLANLLVHIPNEGQRTTKWIKGKLVCTGGAKLKAEGMVKGASDLVLFVPNSEYHALCLETKVEETVIDKGKMKVKRTYQSPEQKDWQSEVEKQGYKYVVYRSIEEFIKIVKDYLNKR